MDEMVGAAGKIGSVHHHRIDMPFHADDEPVVAHAYVANPDWLQEPAPPSLRYPGARDSQQEILEPKQRFRRSSRRARSYQVRPGEQGFVEAKKKSSLAARDCFPNLCSPGRI